MLWDLRCSKGLENISLKKWQGVEKGKTSRVSSSEKKVTGISGRKQTRMKGGLQARA